MKTRIFTTLTLTVALTLILIGCGNSDHQSYQGYVAGENIYLASPYSGFLVEVLAGRGQPVRKGQLLYKLDADPQQLLLTEASAGLQQAKQIYNDLKKPKRPEELAAIQAQIEQASAQVKLADLRVKRNQTLYQKHVLDKDTFDASLEHYQESIYLKAQYEANLALAKLGSREDQIKAQQSQIAVLTSKMKQAKWELAQKSIYAPADGVIFDTYFRKGEFVAAQKPIAAVLAPENIRIEFFVPDVGLAALHVGKKITFSCDGCSKNNPAVIHYVSPEAEYVPPLVYSLDNRDKLVFRIKANISNPMNFKPGQPVVVTVSKNE